MAEPSEWSMQLKNLEQQGGDIDIEAELRKFEEALEDEEDEDDNEVNWLAPVSNEHLVEAADTETLGALSGVMVSRRNRVAALYQRDTTTG